jgi:hypothetical protein
MPGGRERGPLNTRPACRRRDFSAALVHWKKSPAALFVPDHPWTAPGGPTSGRPNALLRVCRTSASFPLAKSVVFASCVAGGNANECARIRARGFPPLRRPDDRLHAAGRRTKLSTIALHFALPHGTFQMAICHKWLNRLAFCDIADTAMARCAAVRDRPDGKCVRRAPKRPPGRTARREIDLGRRGPPGR